MPLYGLVEAAVPEGDRDRPLSTKEIAALRRMVAKMDETSQERMFILARVHQISDPGAGVHVLSLPYGATSSSAGLSLVVPAMPPLLQRMLHSFATTCTESSRKPRGPPGQAPPTAL